MAGPDLEARSRLPDDVLIRRIREGDEACFEQLYERYLPRVYRFVQKRLRNRADTEETVQEVFFNVFSSLESFRGEAPFAAWVFGLTRRTIAARFKKKRHATVPLDDHEADPNIRPGVAPSAEPTPHEVYEFQERIAQMGDRARRKLNSEQRQLFVLHHLENRSITEIAAQLHKTEDAIKSNLYRARKILLAP